MRLKILLSLLPLIAVNSQASQSHSETVEQSINYERIESDTGPILQPIHRIPRPIPRPVLVQPLQPGSPVDPNIVPQPVEPTFRPLRKPVLSSRPPLQFRPLTPSPTMNVPLVQPQPPESVTEQILPTAAPVSNWHRPMPPARPVPRPINIGKGPVTPASPVQLPPRRPLFPNRPTLPVVPVQPAPTTAVPVEVQEPIEPKLIPNAEPEKPEPLNEPLPQPVAEPFQPDSQPIPLPEPVPEPVPLPQPIPLPVSIPVRVSQPIPQTRPMPQPWPRPQPMPRPNSQPVPEPKPQPIPQPRPNPNPWLRPSPQPKPQPLPSPEPVPEPVPLPELDTVPIPEPSPVSIPDSIPVPIPDPIPVPIPQPRPRPNPWSRPVPLPQPLPQPEPEPLPWRRSDPLPEPVSEPIPLPEPVPVPVPIPEPVPEPIPQPNPSPNPWPRSLPQPEPEPLMMPTPIPEPIALPQPVPVHFSQPRPTPSAIPMVMKPWPTRKPKPVTTPMPDIPSKPLDPVPNFMGDEGVPVVFNCIQDGFYSIENECDTYVECRRRSAVKFMCPDGLHFNPKALWPEYPCAYPSEVQCESRSIKRQPEPTSECPRQYGYFPMNDGDCSRYFMCQEGLATVMNCPAGLVFNVQQSSCDWPENVPTCKSAVFQGFTCPSMPVDEDGVPYDWTYKFRYGKSCKEYVACQRGHPRLLSCDPGLSFDEASESCIDSDYVMNCSKDLLF